MSFGMPSRSCFTSSLRHHDAGRVVRVAEVDEADVAGVATWPPRSSPACPADKSSSSGSLIASALIAGRVLIHRAVRRARRRPLSSIQQEGRAHHLQNLAGAGAEQDVLGLHAVVRRQSPRRCRRRDSRSDWRTCTRCSSPSSPTRAGPSCSRCWRAWPCGRTARATSVPARAARPRPPDRLRPRVQRWAACSDIPPPPPSRP